MATATAEPFVANAPSPSATLSQRDPDDFDWVSSTGVSHVQGLLSQTRLLPLAYRFSSIGQLSALCQLDAFCPVAVVRLSALLLRSL